MRYGTVVTLLAAGLALCAPPSRAASPAAHAGQNATCSKATAEQVAAPDNPWFGPDSPSPTERLVQVLCGPFTGPGSNSMAVTFSAETCWEPQGWAVYEYTGGAWARVTAVNTWLSEPLVAIGSDLHEVDPVFSRGDPRCLPSGGERWRVWHWDGTRLTAGHWQPVKQAIAVWSGRTSAGLTCQIRDDGSDPGSWVYCWRGVKGRSQHVRLNADGSVDTVHRQTLPLGLGGPTPPWNTSTTTARFRCIDAHAGLRCTLRKTGAGFLFDKHGRTHRITA